jgi:hypothetical protein
MEETAEPIAAANLTSLAIADDVRTGGWIRRLQPKRPVRTMTVVVVDIDPKHLLQVPSPDDQQPVKTLGPDRPDPSLREGVRVGRLHRGDQHLGPVRAEHIIKATGELRVTVAEHKAQSSPSLVEYQEQVPGLLGDPGTIRVGRHPGQVDPPGVQFDEEQHLQPPQPDGFDGEAGRRRRSLQPAGTATPARLCSPAAGQDRARGGGVWRGSRLLRRACRGVGVLLGCAGRPSGGSPWPGGRSAVASPRRVRDGLVDDAGRSRRRRPDGDASPAASPA